MNPYILRLIDPALLSKINTWRTLTADVQKILGIKDLTETFQAADSLSSTATEKKVPAPVAPSPKRSSSSLRDNVVAVLDTAPRMSIQEIMDTLKAKGWLPGGANPRGYVTLTLCTNPNLFRRVGRGVYMLAVHTKTKGPKTPKANGIAVTVAPVEDSIKDVLRQYPLGLIAATIARRLQMDPDGVRVTLADMFTRGVLEKETRTKRVYWKVPAA